MTEPRSPRPSVAPLAALAVLAALAALAAPALAVAPGDLGAEVQAQLPALPAAPDLGVDAALALPEGPLAPADLALPGPGLPALEGIQSSLPGLALQSDQAGGLPLLSLGPSGSGSQGGQAHSQSRAAAAPSDPAAATAGPMAAAAGLAAAGTLALKLEPVRRGLFLLALPLYSRLKRHELLENGVRERIYRALEQQPGLSIIQVCRAAKVGWGTAVYHLQRLERDQLVVSRRDGQYRRFFLNGHAPEPVAATAPGRVLRADVARRIAQVVAENPGCAQKDVCLALGISPPLASKWLGRLLEAGLVSSRREWKLVRYEPTPALRAELPGLAVPAGAPAAAAAPVPGDPVPAG